MNYHLVPHSEPLRREGLDIFLLLVLRMVHWVRLLLDRPWHRPARFLCSGCHFILFLTSYTLIDYKRQPVVICFRSNACGYLLMLNKEQDSPRCCFGVNLHQHRERQICLQYMKGLRLRAKTTKTQSTQYNSCCSFQFPSTTQSPADP